MAVTVQLKRNARDAVGVAHHAAESRGEDEPVLLVRRVDAAREPRAEGLFGRYGNAEKGLRREERRGHRKERSRRRPDTTAPGLRLGGRVPE